MSKKLIESENIYIAPEIYGRLENSQPYVYDERLKRELDPLNFDDKITIYEREVTGWFLSPAKEMLEINCFKNSFISLMVSMSYIEGVQQYKVGESSRQDSQRFFIESMNGIYCDRFSQSNLKLLYSKTRCGLFHNGMTRGGVIFKNDYPEVLDFSDEIIRINPTKLIDDLIQNFNQYTDNLRDIGNSSYDDLRSNFTRIFSVMPD